MNYRNYKFYARTDKDADCTIVHDINIEDPISSIVLMFEFHKTDHVVTHHPMKSIEKIELVDGSDVLFSLDGYQAEALDWYNNGGHFRSNYNMYTTASTITRVVGIHFGRFLFDPEYAFDPRQFTNPQLRIELDIDGWATNGDHIYVTGWANLFDESAPAVKGFFMSKELKEWTMADNTHEYTDLPLDHPYESIFFQPFLEGTEPNQTVQNIKISEDHDKRIPYDMGGQDLLRCVLNDFPAVEEYYWVSPHTVTRYFYIAPTARVIGLGQPWAAAANDQGTTCYEGDGGKLAVITKTAASNTQLYVRGYVPHAVYKIPTGLKMYPETYYDVRRLGSLRADIEGAAAGTGHLFLQQLRGY